MLWLRIEATSEAPLASTAATAAMLAGNGSSSALAAPVNIDIVPWITPKILAATAIAELALEPTPRILRVGVTSLPECGTNDEVLAHHKLDVASLVKSMRYVVPQIA